MEGRANSVEKYEPPTLRIIDSVAELTHAQRETRLGGSDRFIFQALHKSPADARLCARSWITTELLRPRTRVSAWAA